MSLQRLVMKCLMKCLLAIRSQFSTVFQFAYFLIPIQRECRLDAYQCNQAVAPRLYGIKQLHQREDHAKSGLLTLRSLINPYNSEKGRFTFIYYYTEFYTKDKIFKVVQQPIENLLQSFQIKNKKSDHVSMSGFCLWIAIDCNTF